MNILRHFILPSLIVLKSKLTIITFHATYKTSNVGKWRNNCRVVTIKRLPHINTWIFVDFQLFASTSQFNQSTPNSTLNFMRSILLIEKLELFEVEVQFGSWDHQEKVRIDYPCSSQEIQGWRVNALLIDDHEVFVATSTNLYAKKTIRIKPYY